MEEKGPMERFLKRFFFGMGVFVLVAPLEMM